MVILSGLAWFTEALSIGSLGASLPALKATMGLTPSDVGLLVAGQTLGVAFGLIPAGRLADKFGRKKVLVGGIIFYSAFTFLCGFATSFQSLLLIRFLAGIGMGSIFPLPYAIVCEFVRKMHRTMFNGFMDACLSVGYLLAPLLGFLVFPSFSQDVSWRIFFMLASAPILYAGIVYKFLPESPRWLERNGRLKEADAILTMMERGAEKTLGHALPPPVEPPVYAAAPTSSQPVSGVFGSRLIGRTIARTISATGVFFMFYVVMSYMPTIFVAGGNKFATSLLFTAMIIAVSVPGKLFNGWFGEKFGRRAAYVVFMGIAAGGALLFAAAGSIFGAVGFACIMSFFGLGAFPSLKMSMVEQYPTAFRTTGAATIEALARLFGGVVGSYAMPLLLHTYGVGVSFVTIAVVALIGVVTELTFTIETKGKTLEELEGDMQRGAAAFAKPARSASRQAV
ncbi:MAG TPA: MFS transporter [Acidocella sp.]|nr:MFS transporter [Acidocella sp.]HQU03352.1 MFS transporter [Acidocella sp.]